MFNIAINGFGRIGRCVFRALYASPYREQFRIAAINEPAPPETIAHLLKYDSTHGRFPFTVSLEKNIIRVDGEPILLSSPEQGDAPAWQEAGGIDILLDCTGLAIDDEYLAFLNKTGIKRTLFSQPTEASLDKTIVYGVNHHLLSAADHWVSNASCTSNCIAPVIDVLNKNFTLTSGMITTIHSAMNDQPVIDAYHHQDLRKTRSAMQSIIPVDTSLAKGLPRVIPNLRAPFEATALRVPTINVSAMQLTLLVEESININDVVNCLENAARQEMKGIIAITDEPLASCDFNQDTHSVIVDAGQTRVCNNNMVKLLCWFDNEWAYANRMLDVSHYWLNL